MTGSLWALIVVPEIMKLTIRITLTSHLISQDLFCNQELQKRTYHLDSLYNKLQMETFLKHIDNNRIPLNEYPHAISTTQYLKTMCLQSIRQDLPVGSRKNGIRCLNPALLREE